MEAQHEDNGFFRYGAPAAVVDPLLSFLFDLRRMEDTILSTLEHFGVPRRSLPAPFGQDHRDNEITASTSSDAAGVHSETYAVPASMFETYVKTTLTHGCAPSPADSLEAVQQVLTWLDGQQQSPPPSTSASRSLLAIFAAAGKEQDAFLVDATTKAEVHLKNPSKCIKREGNTNVTSLANDESKDAEEDRACSILSLSEAEVYAATDMCKRYGKLLKSGTKELEATINAVTTSDLAASYSCHAKWVEVSREDAKVKCVLPASKVLKKNYEQLIRLNDALATCQAAVHNAYVALEEHVDVLLEEAQVVDKEERAFQRYIAQARAECAGLQELRRRLKRTRKALIKAPSVNA